MTAASVQNDVMAIMKVFFTTEDRGLPQTSLLD